MSNIVHEILFEQDLSRAGELFSINNEILLKDFATTIDIIKNIVDNRKYVNHLNEQSIVEIVLTRCISALRDTKIITNYYEELLDLLEICLKYNLNKFDDNKTANTPHANIVSDIFSCILLDYLDLSLSERAIPICIRLLQQGSKELSREISSYLNLIACRDPKLLTHYVHYIVDTILKGNSNLCRLLYQICETDVECIYPLTKHLVKALKIIENTNDAVYILQIMYLISLNHVQLVIVHLDDIIEYLVDDDYQDIVLDILFSIANQAPISLEPYLCLFEKSSYYDSFKVCKIISTVGRSLKSKSEYCTNLLIKRIDNTDKTLHVLKEIYAIAAVHPNVLDTCYRSLCYRCDNPTFNMKAAIDQLHKLKSSSVLSATNGSSIILNTNNQSSFNNSLDSIENCNYNRQRSNNMSNDELNIKSRDKLSSLFTNSETKSFVLNSNIDNSDELMANKIDPPLTIINSANSRELLKFDKSFTIHEEDDEEVLKEFDENLKEIEKGFTEKLNLNEQEVEMVVEEKRNLLQLQNDSLKLAPNQELNEKDVVQQFCEKHLTKIKVFVENLCKFLPLPVECWIEEKDKSSKKLKYLNLNFTCFLKGQNCLFDRNYFEIKTSQPSLWIHIMFLSLQSRWSQALTQRDISLFELRKCYERFKCSEKLQFVHLITSAFPNEKQQKILLNELHDIRFFDLFEFNQENQQWFCFLCSNPQKAHDLLNETTLIEGQLREKRGKWKFLKRWKKRLYSLTGGNMVYVKKDMRQESLSVRYIRSIQTVKSSRNIPKAFEIFTNANRSFILKAKNSQDVEQWVQYLQISKAHEISRCNLNDSTIYKTCL